MSADNRKEQILKSLLEICGDEGKLRKWLNEGQPFLRGKTAQEVLDSGKDLELLEVMVRAIRFGDYA